MMQQKKTYKLLVLDLDGTLTNSKKEISQNTKKAIRQAQKRGVTVVLASGRPTYGIIPLAEEISLAAYNGYILSFNGGTIIDGKTGEVIAEQKLKLERVPALYEIACAHGVEILSYVGQDIVSENIVDQYVQYEAALNRMPLRQVTSFTETVDHAVPKCLIVGDAERLIPLEKMMQERFGHEMSIYRSEPFFLELMPLHIDKAQSLAKLLAHLGMDKEDMIACGDGFNDLSMIKYAGLGVAMANAQQAVKEAADFITYSNEEDGVAHVIEQFLL